MSLEIDVFTLFPDHLAWLPGSARCATSLESGAARAASLDLRGWALGEYRQVDDAPYGGGAGMLVRVDVVCAALEETYGRPIDQVREARRIVVLTPVGRRLADAVAAEYAAWQPGDAAVPAATRASTSACTTTWPPRSSRSAPTCCPAARSPPMAVIDAVARKLPGALGKAESHLHDSFSQAMGGRPEYPALHHVRRSSAAGRCRRCCCRATTRRVAAWRDAARRARATLRICEPVPGDGSIRWS